MQEKPEIRQLSRSASKIRWLVLAGGIILSLAGIWRQEYKQVLARAVQICLGCIGIG